jgi:hypothetical protein
LMSRIPRFNALGGMTRKGYQRRLRVVLEDPRAEEQRANALRGGPR